MTGACGPTSLGNQYGQWGNTRQKTRNLLQFWCVYPSFILHIFLIQLQKHIRGSIWKLLDTVFFWPHLWSCKVQVLSRVGRESVQKSCCSLTYPPAQPLTCSVINCGPRIAVVFPYGLFEHYLGANSCWPNSHLNTTVPEMENWAKYVQSWSDRNDGISCNTSAKGSISYVL